MPDWYSKWEPVSAFVCINNDGSYPIIFIDCDCPNFVDFVGSLNTVHNLLDFLLYRDKGLTGIIRTSYIRTASIASCPLPVADSRKPFDKK